MPGATNGLLVVLLGGLCLALAVSVRRRDVAAAVNVLASLAAVAVSLPLAIGVPLSGGGTVLAPALPLWIVTAGLLHSIGMLGPYESVWWWDHLTHTVSAALLAALSYAGVTVAADAGAIPPLSTAAVAAATIGFTLAAGVFWELVELVARALGERYDVEPVLVHYGWRDTGLDLVFDFVGAVAVVLLDLRVFVEPAARVPELTGTLLLWSTGVVLGGSALLALGLAVTVDRRPSEW
jgi:hypothetical protein